MAAADPELALRLAKETADIYGDAVARLLRIVADRLARGITEPGWAERKLDDVVRLRAEILDEISRLDDAGADAAERAVVDAHRRGVRAAAGELRGPRIAGTLTGTQRTAVDALAREIVATPAADRIAEGVVEQLAGTHLRILRSTLDAYRQTVAEAALPGVAAGVDTRRVAAQRALDRFAQQGVTGFVDAAGRRWQLESYVEMATRTGSGRAMVQGRLDAYRAAGRDLVIVSDAPQECSACRPWEGKVLSLSGQTSGRLDRGFSVAGTVDQATSAGLFHANCFPGDVLVSGPPVRAADARWYEGDLVVIHTAGGDELPVTPNHPVLTAEGWVAAGSLHVGDQLVRHLAPERMHSMRPDDERVPSMIGDVARALRESGPVVAVRVPAAAEQFHGDGLGGDVDVVLADRSLESGLEAAMGEPSGDASLVVGGVRLGALLAERTTLEVLSGERRPADGVMGGGDLSSALLCGHGRPPAPLGFGSADPQASAGEEVADRRLVDADVGGDLRLSLAGFVAFDDVVALGRRQVRCHVYNLQTEDSWYTANGIVVHNCRHDLRPYVAGLTERMTHTADREGDRARQQQRYLERGVRRWKRVEAVALDDAARARAQARSRAWQARIRGHVDEHGLKRQRQREQVGRAR